MKGNHIYDIIGKYLADEASEKENEIFQNWLGESERNTQEFELHKKVWEETQLNFNSTDSEAVFKNLLNKIDDQHELEIADGQRKVAGKVKRRYIFITKIAASLLLFATMWYSYNTEFSKSPEVVIKTVRKQNMAGQKLKFFLPDGSEVWLNAESMISFPEKFTGGKREVILEGEAFFDVIKSLDQPFIVKAGEICATVLGTSFNVKAFKSELIAHVALKSGKVKVEIEGKDEKKDMFLQPGEAIKYDRSDGTALKEQFDQELLLSWKEGIIHFKDASIDEIVSTLSRWYGVKIHVNNRKNELRQYTGPFDNENLENVLKSMSYSLEFDYSRDQKNVTINLN